MFTRDRAHDVEARAQSALDSFQGQEPANGYEARIIDLIKYVLATSYALNNPNVRLTVN